MRQTQPSGLQISRPQRSAVSVCWLLPILSGAAIYALLALTGLERPWLPGLAGACVCSLLLLFGKRKWIYPGVLALLVLSLLLFRGRFLDGFWTVSASGTMVWGGSSPQKAAGFFRHWKHPLTTKTSSFSPVGSLPPLGLRSYFCHIGEWKRLLRRLRCSAAEFPSSLGG